jgi:hypothetical protein
VWIEGEIISLLLDEGGRRARHHAVLVSSLHIVSVDC